MKIGMCGLGKMGANMAERLRLGGVEVAGFDVNPDVSDVASVQELVASLEGPKVVWMMLPLGPIPVTLDILADILEPGDVIVDGGNSYWRDSQERYERFKALGVGYVDCGTSGGVWGLTEGYALMVGGDQEHVDLLMPVFDALRPEGGGFVHAGPSGMGHFSKQVHNAVEYGMMQAFAEGYELLGTAGADQEAVFASWQHGSVVRSWLLDLAVKAMKEDEGLASIAGVANDSGEGRWTVKDAVDLAVPTPVTAAALFARFTSRQEDSAAMKLIAALRNQFGGHAVVPSTKRS